MKNPYFDWTLWGYGGIRVEGDYDLNFPFYYPASSTPPTDD